MKEFQALGLDVSIINDEGETLQLKEIEDAEDKEDNSTTFEELESPAKEILEQPTLQDEAIEEDVDDDDDDFDEFDSDYDEDFESIELDDEEGAEF